MAQDPPEPLDLTALTQVLGSESVSEAVSSDAKPDLDLDAAEELGHGNEPDRLAAGPQQDVVVARLRPPAVQVADQTPPKSAAQRDPRELRPVAMSDLEEGAFPVVLVVLNVPLRLGGLSPADARERRCQR